jgi:hypothetical protein
LLNAPICVTSKAKSPGAPRHRSPPPLQKPFHWVYRELARAHYERGEMEKAITGYVQSLAAEEREAVRREMQALLVLM